MAISVGLTGSVLSVPAWAAPAHCSSPKTCRLYKLVPVRWPTSPQAPLTIHYSVSRRLVAAPLTVSLEDLLGATRAAARVWESANPRVHFVYDGVTDNLANDATDGRNVVGYGSALQGVAMTVTQNSGNAITQTDLVLNIAVKFAWTPCRQRDGQCGASPARDPLGPAPGVPPDLRGVVTVVPADLQGVITHEFGHWLSVDHSDAPVLTMNPGLPPASLAAQTLGIGDVLGVRAAYPCGRCGGPPRVYTP